MSGVLCPSKKKIRQQLSMILASLKSRKIKSGMKNKKLTGHLQKSTFVSQLKKIWGRLWKTLMPRK